MMWGTGISALNVRVIRPLVVKSFHKKTKNVNVLVALEEKQPQLVGYIVWGLSTLTICTKMKLLTEG